jgi:hypothetical protein
MRVMSNPSQQPEQMSLLERRRPKALAALRELFSDGEWHGGEELRQVDGWRYGARLFELRRGEDGRPPLTIDVRCESGGLYEYQQTAVGR